MSNVFLTADTHFGHLGVCKFLDQHGEKLRPWDTPEEMDEALVKNWNAVVGQKDRVYHLGDVVINRRCLTTLSRLNGRLVLVKGNHDIFKLSDYLPYFDDIRAYHVLDKFILSHIPIHADSKARFRGNIHGHLHERQVPDPWYECVSVERTGFTPIAFETVRATMVERLSIL
jgi:calcineurin-like phosphoesterase family protein